MTMNLFNIRSAVEEADLRIRPHVLETQLRRSDHLSRLTGANVLCKLENLQVTGSFKARGAANKIASLSAEQRMRGVVTHHQAIMVRQLPPCSPIPAGAALFMCRRPRHR